MKQVKVWADPQVAEAFKMACSASGVSMASELSRFMTDRTNILSRYNEKEFNRLGSRRGRRKEVTLIISQLEQICDAEEASCSRIPDNLQGGRTYEASDQSVDILEQAIELLQEAY